MLGELSKLLFRGKLELASYFVTGASDMIDVLANRFQDREAFDYVICEIDSSNVHQDRAKAKLRVSLTVEGFSVFQVMVYTPGRSVLKAVTCICLCNK